MARTIWNVHNVKPGDKFNKWTVIEGPFSYNSKGHVICECDCVQKTRKQFNICKITSGQSKDCGCGRAERYAQSRRYGTAVKDGMKTCAKCLISKKADDFYRAQDESDGLAARCKQCSKSQYIKFTYGISEELYYKILINQNFKCAICQENLEDGKFAIDHNHDLAYKHARGILCGNCNRGLGCFKDSISSLDNAKSYLQITNHIVYKDNYFKSVRQEEIISENIKYQNILNKYKTDYGYDMESYWKNYPEDKPVFEEYLPLNYEI